MTKSRPALSVKRKQAAVRSTSKSAASKTKGNGIDLGVNDLRYWKKLAPSEKAEANELGETMLSYLNDYRTRLTAAVAEAEGLREKIERDTQRTIAENDRHEKQYVQKFREWEALIETEAKLGAEIEALDASRLLQANTLKALREELKLAKKDATDWAVNHEKEKRRADETETKLEGARLIIIFLAVVALGVAGCMIFLEVAR